MDRRPSLRRFCGLPPFTRRILRLGLVLLVCLPALGQRPAPARAEAEAWSSRPFPRIEGGVVLSLAAAPSNPAVMAALVSDGPGARVFRSANAGASWAETYRFTETVQTLVIHPSDPTRLYAGGLHGMWRSGDSGQTWQRVSSLGFLMAFPADGYLYAAGKLDGLSACPDGMFSLGFSADSGDTWRFNPLGCSIQFYQLASSPAAPQTAYLVAKSHDPVMGLALKTQDAGQTWMSFALAVNDAVQGLLVNPADPVRLYASGDSGVIYSQDAGQSWVYPPDSGAIGYYNLLALSGGVLYAVPPSWDPAPVYASRDGGQTWWKTVATLPSGANALASSPAALYAGTIGFGIYRINESGWGEVNDGLVVPAVPLGISASPSGDLYALANLPHWSLYRSRDGGKTWSGSLLEQTDFSRWVTLTPGGLPLRPLQSAATSLPAMPLRIVLAHPTEPGTAWATGERGIFELRGGMYDSTSAADYAVRDLSVSSFDPDHPLAAANRSGAGYVLQRQCVEALCIWEKVLATWPAFELSSVAVDPNNPAHILVSGFDYNDSTGSYRVYGSSDRGASWHLLFQGPNGPRDLEISPYDSRIVFGFVYGASGEKSLLRSQDDGITWKEVGPTGAFQGPLTMNAPLSFDGLAQVYYGTSGGLYRRPVASGEWVLEGFEGRAVTDLTAVWGSHPYLWALTETALYQASLPAARRYWLPLVGR